VELPRPRIGDDPGREGRKSAESDRPGDGGGNGGDRPRLPARLLGAGPASAGRRGVALGRSTRRLRRLALGPGRRRDPGPVRRDHRVRSLERLDPRPGRDAVGDGERRGASPRCCCSMPHGARPTCSSS
jgi:hypothetical protein